MKTYYKNTTAENPKNMVLGYVTEDSKFIAQDARIIQEAKNIEFLNLIAKIVVDEEFSPYCPHCKSYLNFMEDMPLEDFCEKVTKEVLSELNK